MGSALRQAAQRTAAPCPRSRCRSHLAAGNFTDGATPHAIRGRTEPLAAHLPISHSARQFLTACATAVLTITALMLAGCGRSNNPADEPSLEVSRLQTLPNELGLLHQQAKPGHWSAATVDIKANHETFRGQLSAEVGTNALTAYRLEVRRPLLLPKQRLKPTELLFYVPTGHFRNVKPRLDIRLFESSRPSRPTLTDANQIQSLMPAYQFYFLVLTNEPDRYRFLTANDDAPAVQNHLRWLRLGPYSNFDVLVPEIEKRPPLPSSPLAWTMLSHILWDTFDPQQFSKQQQQAMLDWLHWGGQLIVSGPGSMELLEHSFLAPYLPATTTGTSQLDSSEIEKLTRRLVPQHPPLRPRGAWACESLRPAPQSETLATAANKPIVVDRRVGRGRIVVSALPISHHELVQWPGAGEWIDRFLLRRPRPPATIDTLLALPSPPLDCFDPRRNSRFRILSRDAGCQQRLPLELLGTPRTPWDRTVSFDGHFYSFGGAAIGAGVGGWNDFSQLSQAAWHALRSASQVKVPSASRVAQLLGIYLLVLVPINWTVFRLLGRPQWAWFAVPAISLAFTVVVVWVAQLDIGFARSRNEVRIVEMHGGYPRAHVTHYTALYASLSTTYQARYDSPTAVAVPFSAGRRTVFRQRRPLIVLDQGPPVELRNLEIASNTTGLLHGEYFAELPGSIDLHPTPTGGWIVRNETGLHLEDAVLLAGDRVARLGSLASGTAADIIWEPRPTDASHTDHAMTANQDSGQAAFSHRRRHAIVSPVPHADEGEIDLRSLLEAAEFFDPEDRGQWRLVARCRTAPGRVEIRPAANQVRYATVVVAYLKHAPLPAVVAATPSDTTKPASSAAPVPMSSPPTAPTPSTPDPASASPSAP